jgi:N-acetylmuramoyl-L-alanine amidase
MIIDIGHGGKDPGAVSGQTYEKNIVLAYGLNLGEIAEEAGRKVGYTRNTDKFVELGDRGKKCAAKEIFISCHVNAAGNPAANGCSVWYHGGHNDSEKLAAEVFQHIMATRLFSKYGAGVISDKTRYENGFAVLRDAVGKGCRAAILIEPGFLSNTKDRATLTNPTKRLLLAEAINNGITDFLAQVKKNA